MVFTLVLSSRSQSSEVDLLDPKMSIKNPRVWGFSHVYPTWNFHHKYQFMVRLILDFKISSFKKSSSNFLGQVELIVSGLLSGCWSHCLSFSFLCLMRRLFFGSIPSIFFLVILLGLSTRSCTYPCTHIGTPPQAQHME